jgi:Mitochondrial carrier protein
MTINSISQASVTTNTAESKISDSSNDKKPGIPFTVVSGALIAGVELLSFGHICDRIKTCQQANPELRSIKEAARRIYSVDGFMGFYTGIRWNILSHSGKAGFRWAAMSLMDDVCHRALSADLKAKYPSLQKFLLGISVSLVESFFLVCPAESFKTKEMTKNPSKAFHVYKWIKNTGARSMFDGWDAVLFRQAISWCSFLVAYDKSSRFVRNLTGKKKLNLLEQFSVGALAGGINVLCTTPIDTVKTQLQKQDPLNKKSIISAVPLFYQKYGLRGFYSGLAIRMARSTWYAGITLVMMDRLGIFRSHHA